VSVTLDQPLAPRECAELAGVSYHTILRAIRGGHLRAFQPPGTTLYRVAPEDFHAWLYGHPVTPAPREEPPRAQTRRTGVPARGSVEALAAIERGAA
jgi:excisionase family DNA binding protein